MLLLRFSDDSLIDFERTLRKLGIEHQKLHSLIKRYIRYEYSE